jgi:hypothetical protein
MASLENKVVRKKKLDKELTLRVIENDAAERIFIEFSSKENGLFLQKSFQDNYLGRLEADKFEESFETIEEFKQYFEKKGVKK